MSSMPMVRRPELRPPQLPPHTWAAGSYLDLFAASAVMQVFFGFTLYWILFVDPQLTDDNLWMPALGLLSAMGWMIAIVLGIGFDITPLNFGSAPFDNTLISMVTALNLSGQILIIIGVLVGNVEWFEKLGLMGATLLAISLCLLGPVSFQFVKMRMKSKDKIGPWYYGSAFGMPVIGVIGLVGWLFWTNEVIIELFWLVIVDTFWGMMAFATIIAHFQGRLGWKLMSKQQLNIAFIIFLLLSLLHVSLVMGLKMGYISDPRVQATFAAPLLWVFFVSRPDRIWRKVMDKKLHCTQMLSAHLWLVPTTCVGFVEGYYDLSSGMFYARFMLLAGVAAQAIWAAGDYLHDDHKFKPKEDRRQAWVSIVSTNLAMVGIIYLFIDYVKPDAGLTQIDDVTAATVVLMMIAFFDVAIWLIRETLWNHQDWQRIPLFYGTRHADEDDAYADIEDPLE